MLLTTNIPTSKWLRQIKKSGYGIEIGPSHNPIAPKKNGYKVDIIDHMSREDLIAKYKEHGVNPDNIEDVDSVWKGENYSELTRRCLCAIRNSEGIPI